MVEYFDIQSLCRLLPSIHSKMNCFICTSKGVRRCRIRAMGKDVMLCERHDRIFGDGTQEALDQGKGPVIQNIWIEDS